MLPYYAKAKFILSPVEGKGKPHKKKAFFSERLFFSLNLFYFTHDTI
jgi:hypothetical protein